MGMTAKQPILTIAICTYNRATTLGTVCSALFRQTVPIDQFLVLIVDNASTDDTEERIKEIMKLSPNFFYVFEPMPGLSHARNAAWKNCKTPWITYIDDDSKPEPHFVEALLKVIADDNYDVIAGRIKPWCLYPLPSWFLSEYEEYAPFSQNGELLGPSDFAYGGNMTIRHSWFEAVGGFNSNLGILGRVAPLGEETELQMRIRIKGGRIYFASDAVIAHCAVPSKYTITGQFRIRYRSGKSTQILFAWRGQWELWRLILKIPYPWVVQLVLVCIALLPVHIAGKMRLLPLVVRLVFLPVYFLVGSGYSSIRIGIYDNASCFHYNASI